MDFSNFEVYAEDDTHYFLNGSIKFNADVKAPWKSRVINQKFIQNEWVMQAYDRKFEDFCSSIHNPMEPWYNSLKHVPKCPYKKGVSSMSEPTIVF
jgi:hypothetical protein